ncbi:MAG TPA: hypothetical protein VN041_12155 [Microbacterium sp.]|nr:hypothetical protein [Microbacterium sp.]
MAGGYQVGIGSETKAFKQGIDTGVIAPLEDAQKELLELGRNRGPEQLEKQLREDQKATEKLGDETKRTANAIEREYRDSYRKMKNASDDALDDGAKGMSRLREGAGEVTQEIGQNLGEAVSSVRGNLADLGQVGQDTLGGLAATLAGTGGAAGILGAAALAAGATGLGLVTAELEKQNDRTQKLRQYFSEAWKAAVDGGRDYIDTATLVSQINEIALGEDFAEQRKNALEVSKRTGLDLQTIYRALAGDAASLEQVHGRLTESEREYWDTLKAVGEGSKTVTTEQADAYRDQHNAVSALLGDLDGVKSANADAADQARIAARAVSEQLLATIAGAESATQAVDDFGNTLITLPDGQEIVIDAKTGQATSDVSRFKKDTDEAITQLNRRAISLVVKTALRDAQNQVNGFIAANDGKSFRLRGRITVDDGWD